LLKFQHWNVVINRLLPNHQPAISKEFQALLMRAGVNHKLEYELSTIRHNVYDPVEAQRAIMQGADRHRDGCAEPAPERDRKKAGQVNRLGPIAAQDSEPETSTAIATSESTSEDLLAQACGFRDQAELRRLTAGESPHSVLKKLASLQEIDAECKRLRYDSTVGQWLATSCQVSEEDFNRRMQENECVACGSKDHMLTRCPLYRMRSQQEQTQPFRHDRPPQRTREQRFSQQQPVRPQVQQLTNRGRNNSWRQDPHGNRKEGKVSVTDALGEAIQQRVRAELRKASKEYAAPSVLSEDGSQDGDGAVRCLNSDDGGSSGNE
jgi:hypothetical protein